MIKAPEFYTILNEFIYRLQDVGFRKKSKNKYVTREGIELTVVLDRWGWDDERGWGFLMRMNDMRGVNVKRFERPRKMRDITPLALVRDKLLSEAELRNLYAEQVKEHPLIYKQVETFWFEFYDAHHLRQILTKVMPLIAKSAEGWIASVVGEKTK